MLVTISGAQPRKICRRVYLPRDGDVIIARIGATLLAFYILCAPSDHACANSPPTQQTRDLGSFGLLKKGGLRNQSEQTSRSGFIPLFDASAALTTDFNPSVSGTIVGAASWYNPYVESDNTETASGEQYDPDQWTAAIQIDLRAQFGGVAYGKDYRAAYALVESGDKRLIVKINDVGPLKPGRVVDLSERAMRYFDETLLLGLLPNVKLTPLPGDNWMSGPVDGDLTQWCGPETLDAVAPHGYRA
jgi:rare lipoprotein A